MAKRKGKDGKGKVYLALIKRCCGRAWYFFPLWFEVASSVLVHVRGFIRRRRRGRGECE